MLRFPTALEMILRAGPNDVAIADTRAVVRSARDGESSAALLTPFSRTESAQCAHGGGLENVRPEVSTLVEIGAETLVSGAELRVAFELFSTVANKAVDVARDLVSRPISPPSARHSATASRSRHSEDAPS